MVALRHPVFCLLAALRFLTILPISWGCQEDGKYFQGGLFYFPVVGSILGLLGAAVYVIVGTLFPAPVIGVIMVLLFGAFSGFLHYDGLADTSDGFFSSRPKERILEIMKDSRTGAMGVIAIVAVILLKVASLSSLDSHDIPLVLLLMPIAGRVAIVLTMSLLPYAREEGLGRLFYSENCRAAAVFAGVFLGVTASCAGIKAAVILCATLGLIVFLFAIWCKRMIGGATGDTLGASCEICETVTVVCMTSLYY